MKRLTTIAFILVLAVLLPAVVFAQEQAEESFPWETENIPVQAAPERPAATEPPAQSGPEGVQKTQAPAPQAAPDRGLSVKIELTTNAVQWRHTDVRNDQYVDDAELPQADQVYFMHDPGFGDTEFNVRYTDPQKRFGGQFDFRIGAAFNQAEMLTWYPKLDAVGGWVMVTPYFRGLLGKGTWRDMVTEKIGGDKDLGVHTFRVNNNGNNDLTIDTSDSLSLGSDIMAFIPTAYIPMGPAGKIELSGLLSPNEYWLAQKVRINSTELINSNLDFIVPAYATYKFGGAFKYTYPEWVTMGVAYRTWSTRTVSGTDTGKSFQSVGFYMIFTPSFPIGDFYFTGLKIGFGYSAYLEYWNKVLDDDKEVVAPWQGAWHIDAAYTPPFLPDLTLAVYNTLSSYKLDKQDTRFFNQLIDKNNPNTFGDEKSSVNYIQGDISYKFFDWLTATFMIRDYYAVITGNGGIRGQDYGKHIFIVEALARYRVTDLAEFRIGYKYEICEYGTPVNSVVLRNSWTAHNIPVGVVVKW